MTTERHLHNLLVTGGAGFIGSNFVRWMLARHPGLRITVLDKLTYAGNRANLADVASDPRLDFVEGDIADAEVVDSVAVDADVTVNFAAESHVDRSIHRPDDFIQTDVVGTHVLLQAARKCGHQLYVQISTDEVYGDVPVGSSRESDPLAPRSPYAASKAGADLLVMAYAATYGLPVIITRSSNNFGPYQYPEKVVPLFITNALEGEQLPLYGDGQQVRDWLYVEDNCAAIETVLMRGETGEIYNVGAGNERSNRQLTDAILAALGMPDTLVRLVDDRPGHDRRYSVDSAKVRDLGWKPAMDFTDAIERTVTWYRKNEDWWRPIKSGEFRGYYERQYGARLARGRPI